MNAMELMLKQLGIDPQQLKQNAENVGKIVGQVSEQLSRIEAQNKAIDEKLDVLLQRGDTGAAKLTRVG